MSAPFSAKIRGSSGDQASEQMSIPMLPISVSQTSSELPGAMTFPPIRKSFMLGGLGSTRWCVWRISPRGSMSFIAKR